MRALTSIIMLAATGLPANANTYDECEVAISQGDVGAAKEAAKQMIRYSPVPFSRIPEIERCLSFAEGEPYVYSQTLTEFVPRSSRDEAEAEAERKAAQRQKRMQEAQQQQINAELERQRAEKAAERADAERRRAVTIRLVDACRHLYRQRPNETITNSLCYDVFMELGLPE